MSEWVIVGLIFLAVFFFGGSKVKEWAKTMGQAKSEYRKAEQGANVV